MRFSEHIIKHLSGPQLWRGLCSVIDSLFLIKLPPQVGVIDFSMYLKDGGHSSKSAEGWVLLPDR